MDRAQAVRSPLDQLEAQVNLVLEHTGRLFANNARNHGQINNPLRLKQVIAGANNNFHDALDQLEGELTLARAVMRRDLAVYRSQRAARTDPKAASTVKPEHGTNNTAAISLDDDIVMGESPLENAKPSPPKDAVSLPEGEQATESNSSLHLDIPGQDHQAAGHAGDENTGTYSNFDFESLFNDPSSAGAASRASPKDIPAPSPPRPQAEAATTTNPTVQDTKPPPVRTMTIPDEEPIKPASFNDNDDFDFADLTNFGPPDTVMQDTDGISSLLPGLESYANSGGGNGGTDSNSQSAPADFDIFDAAGVGDFGSAPQQQDQKGDAKQDAQGQPEMGNRDDTFDDIMNFTEFDLGDFSGSATGDGSESKFDASFFDI
ncbi:hypothetical protein KCU81_g3473, partial [Aureobasidium melanogenum]|uniref:Uncharacterized protein n=1 Tax=Aureobasidium melanogenum (strain CBS 110374) TaxID=1043003 RepID=A0A074VR18_AURM1